MSRVMVNGCFDVIHIGHVRLLEWAARVGAVHVAINSDESVRRLKGQGRPYFTADDRRMILLGLWPVMDVVVFDEDTPERAIELLNPDVIVVGHDHSLDDPHYADAASRGCCVIQAPHFAGPRTTDIIARIAEHESHHRGR